jgi:hypothetical protein
MFCSAKSSHISLLLLFLSFIHILKEQSSEYIISLSSSIHRILVFVFTNTYYKLSLSCLGLIIAESPIHPPSRCSQKAHLGTDKVSLPSVVALTLGKEAPFGECLLVHSRKGLGKVGTFAECLLEHSAKGLAKGPTGT